MRVREATRLRLGFVIPSTNFVVEPDVFAMVPRGVSAHFSRLLITGGDLTAAGYPDIWTESNLGLALAIDQLASARVACIGYAVTAGSFFGGRRWEEDLRGRITERTGMPATSTAYAIVQALMKVGTRRISVATAYEEFLNTALCSFLEEYGLEIVALDGLGDTRIQQPASESPERVAELVRKVNSDRAQAVVISCAGLSVLDLLEPLEDEIRKPVVSSNQAVFWSALRLAGYGQPVSGFGSLLRNY